MYVLLSWKILFGSIVHWLLPTTTSTRRLKQVVIVVTSWPLAKCERINMQLSVAQLPCRQRVWPAFTFVFSSTYQSRRQMWAFSWKSSRRCKEWKRKQVAVQKIKRKSKWLHEDSENSNKCPKTSTSADRAVGLRVATNLRSWWKKINKESAVGPWR